MSTPPSRMTKAQLQAELERMAAELAAARAVEGRELVALNTRVPRALRDAVKAHAATTGTSVREVVTAALEAHLAAADNDDGQGQA